MEKDEVLNKFGTKLKHAKVVYDVKNKGEQVLKMAKNI
mgnify:FL=1